MTGKTAKGESTRAHIVHVATDVFASEGYAAARMDNIVERTGLTKGAVYFHFPSKTALAHAVIIDHKLRWLDTIRANVAEFSPGSRQLHFLGEELIRMSAIDPYAWGVMRLAADLGESCQESPLSGWTSLVREILSTGAGDGSLRLNAAPEDLALIIVGGFDGVKNACASTPNNVPAGSSPENIFERRARLYFRGIEKLLILTA